ncbi:MAG: hypothetical protein KJ597_02605 [Nanoarchaeota archaeon]|nr:hypothetical protein [Nanoarchaeota archaeon]MBU1622441.1 hypothetical protein [Nanoarchaeota archaeon]
MTAIEDLERELTNRREKGRSTSLAYTLDLAFPAAREIVVKKGGCVPYLSLADAMREIYFGSIKFPDTLKNKLREYGPDSSYHRHDIRLMIVEDALQLTFPNLDFPNVDKIVALGKGVNQSLLAYIDEGNLRKYVIERSSVETITTVKFDQFKSLHKH